jgi:CheY-like chemotaxis protein
VVSQEAARRKVWISAGAYLAISIGVIEIAGAVEDALLFPDWTNRLVTLLLILGFPLVVVLAWVFDIGEGGLKRTEDRGDPAAEPGPRVTRSRSRQSRQGGPAGRPSLKVPVTRPTTAIDADPAADEVDPSATPPDPERVKRAALGHVRHELRTPINAILGYSEMLLEDAPIGDAAADLARIREGGLQLLHLVDSILDTGRIELDAGRDIDSYAAQIEADLRTPVTSVVGYCEMLIEAEADARQSIMADDLERILQSAHSLLETSSDIIRVAAQAGSDAQVTDTSVLTSGVLAKLQPVHELTDEGEGSLLVVDDNESNRDLLTRQLARRGYMVATAKDGLDALEQMQYQEFDLVLLDVFMPRMDGVEALRRIKADDRLRDTSVIMLSSLDEVDSAVRCLQLGAEEYLSKPVEGALLEARIRANLEIRRLRARERISRECLDSDQTAVDELLTRGIPASMLDRVRAGEVSIIDSWPTAAALCISLDPIPFGAGATDRYVAFLADALTHFEQASLAVPGIDARLTGRPGFIAAVLEPHPEYPMAAPLAGLAAAFLSSLANEDPEAPALFRCGIHSGSLVSSLFGSPRLRFEMWGDAVDTAWAVADKADPGTVLVTPTAKAVLGDSVRLESIGVRDVGQRGSMRLHRIETS